MQAMVDTINDLVEKNTKYSETIKELIDKGIIDEDGNINPNKVINDEDDEENISNALRGEILDSRTLLIKDYDNLKQNEKDLIDQAVTIKEFEIDEPSDINDYVLS